MTARADLLESFIASAPPSHPTPALDKLRSMTMTPEESAAAIVEQIEDDSYINGCGERVYMMGEAEKHIAQAIRSAENQALEKAAGEFDAVAPKLKKLFSDAFGDVTGVEELRDLAVKTLVESFPATIRALKHKEP